MRHTICTLLAALLFALLFSGTALAQTVNSTAAETAYKAGDYAKARSEFEKLIEQFRTQKKDSFDYLVYREAAYLYDRLADCCFTARDWESLRLYLDGLLVVTSSERNLAEAQLAGALNTGSAPATLKFLLDRVEESVRIGSIIQLKRSLALILLETGGEGELGELAIRDYQALAGLMSEILDTERGAYELDIAALDANLAAFDAVFNEVSAATDLEALWKRFPPGGEPDTGAAAAETPAGEAPAEGSTDGVEGAP